MRLATRFFSTAFLALTVYSLAAHGQAALTFAGGNNSPLSITLQQPVVYTITDSDCAASGPLFIFDEVGDRFSGTPQIVSGSISYFINTGTGQPLLIVNSGVNAADVTPGDFFAYGNYTGVAVGSTVVLGVGTITTNGNVAGPPPASGSYPTFLTSDTGVRCSSNGVPLVTTAATVSVSGRVIFKKGALSTRASVALTDMQGNVRTVPVNPFGFYKFEDAAAGQTVTIQVSAKGATFQPQVVTPNEDVENLDFSAQ